MEDISDKLRSIEEIPSEYANVFSQYPKFNVVQSEVLDEVLHTDNSLVVSAPTGSGKTAIFEMAIVRILEKDDSPTHKDLRMVYVSPMKALCAERTVDWCAKFNPYGIKVICVTGDSDNFNIQYIFSYNLIISTPEKWDIITRRWQEYGQILKTIKLFMIDEVQLLNADGRGPTLEVIVCRMKTIESRLLQQNEKIRFLALSASIANVEDIAAWLGATGDRKFFKFSEETRPVQLNKIVLGYTNSHKNFFTFDIALTYRLPNLIKQHAQGKPTLIFCSTRKSVEMTSSHLVENLSINLSEGQKLALQEVADSLSDNKLKKSVIHGIAIHHAGLLLENRLVIERAFREFKIPVLVTTSTLAMGVNLPAHLVIIKSTKTYEKDVGFRDYDDIAIFQMIGRAGRIQFDTSGTAIIMTSCTDKEKFDRMVKCTQPIESNLHKHLTEHLNAEIVLGTITDLDGAMRWVFSTFLYFRAQKCPTKYGLSSGLNAEQIDKKLLEMCQIELSKLVRAGMCTMSETTDITSTIIGEIMATFYVAFDTMKLFTELSGYESLNQILSVISKCKEFADVRLRVNDKKFLNTLNFNKTTREAVRFQLKGKIATVDMKVNCLIQAVLGNLDISEHSLLSDATSVMRNCSRIAGCLIAYLQSRVDCYNALLAATIISKCFNARLWENSLYVAKQLKGIGAILSRLLVKADKDTFQKIARSNPRQIELILNKKAPFGSQIVEEAQHLPFYDVQINIHDSKAHIKICLLNSHNLEEKSTANVQSKMTLLIGNSQNKILLYEQYTHAYLIENSTVERTITIETHKVEYIHANFISEDWVGIDCNVKYDFPKQPGETRKTVQTLLDMYTKGKNSSAVPAKKKSATTVAKIQDKQNPTSKTKTSEKKDSKKENSKTQGSLKSIDLDVNHYIEVLEPELNNTKNSSDYSRRSEDLIVETIEAENTTYKETQIMNNKEKLTQNLEKIVELSPVLESGQNVNYNCEKSANPQDSNILNKKLYERLQNKYSKKPIISEKMTHNEKIADKINDNKITENNTSKRSEENPSNKKDTKFQGSLFDKRQTLYDRMFFKDQSDELAKENEVIEIEDENQNQSLTENDELGHSKALPVDTTPITKIKSPSYRDQLGKSKYPNTPKVNRASKNSQQVKKQLFFEDINNKSSYQTPLLDKLLDSSRKNSQGLSKEPFSDADYLEPATDKISYNLTNSNKGILDNFSKEIALNVDRLKNHANGKYKVDFYNAKEVNNKNSSSFFDEVGAKESRQTTTNTPSQVQSKDYSLIRYKNQDKAVKRNELKKAIVRLVSDSPTNELDIFKGLVDDDLLKLLEVSSDSHDDVNKEERDTQAIIQKKQASKQERDVREKSKTENTVRKEADSTQFSKPKTPAVFGDLFSQSSKTLRWRSPLVVSPANKFSPKFDFSPNLRAPPVNRTNISRDMSNTDEHNTTTGSFNNNLELKNTNSSRISFNANKKPYFPVSDKDWENFEAFPNKKIRDYNASTNHSIPNYQNSQTNQFVINSSQLLPNFERSNENQSVHYEDEHNTTTGSFNNNLELKNKKPHFSVSDKDWENVEVFPNKKIRDYNASTNHSIPNYQNSQTNRSVINSSHCPIFERSNENQYVHYEVLTAGDLCARHNFFQSLFKNKKVNENPVYEKKRLCPSPKLFSSESFNNISRVNQSQMSPNTDDSSCGNFAIRKYSQQNLPDPETFDSNFGPVIPQPRYPHMGYMYHPYYPPQQRFPLEHGMPTPFYTNPFLHHDLNQPMSDPNLRYSYNEVMHSKSHSNNSQSNAHLDLPHTITSHSQLDRQNLFNASQVDNHMLDKSEVTRQIPTINGYINSPRVFGNDTDHFSNSMEQKNINDLQDSNRQTYMYRDKIPEKEFYGSRILPYYDNDVGSYPGKNIANLRGYSSQVNHVDPNVMANSERSSLNVYQTQPQTYNLSKRQSIYEHMFNATKDNIKSEPLAFKKNIADTKKQINRADVRKMFAKSVNKPRFEHKQFLRHDSYESRLDQELLSPNPKNNFSNNNYIQKSAHSPLMPIISRQSPLYNSSSQRQNKFNHSSHPNQGALSPRQNLTVDYYPEMFQQSENEKQFVLKKFLYS